MKKIILSLLILSFIFTSCSRKVVKFWYLSSKSLNPPIDVPASISVNVLDTSLSTTFKNLTSDLKTSIVNDLKLTIFPTLTDNNQAIKIKVNINELKFEQQMFWGCFWFPLLYCGVPGDRVIGKANVTLEMVSTSKHIYKSYHSQQSNKKWISYYSMPKYLPYKSLPDYYPAKIALELAMNDIKTQIEADRENILKTFEISNIELDQNTVKQQIISKAEVDENIPVLTEKKPYRYALIIGNEDYNSFQPDLNSEYNVSFAENDARIFKEYAIKTLGIPEENIILKINAKAIEMNRAFETISLIVKSLNGKAEIIFYYAGHGLPDFATQEPYLIPVDVSAKDLKFAVKQSDVYKKLTEYPTKRVSVFLDACFSGGARNQGLISARSVKIKPKEETIKGSLIIFSASSSEQPALAFKEKQHGMFTYFLLKKLQDSKGNITYKEMSDYLIEQVGVKAAMINQTEQSPKTNISPDALSFWESWKFND